LISHGFFTFFYSSHALRIATGFSAFFCLLIPTLSFPMILLSGFMPAKITAVRLPSETTPAHMKDQSAMFALNRFEKNRRHPRFSVLKTTKSRSKIGTLCVALG